MKYIFITLLIFINGCCNYFGGWAIYEISGTKTNITVKYRGVNSDKKQDKDITTVDINKLPWKIDCSFMQSSCLERMPWFLSAYSESEGEMTISINGYTNTTTNNYIEMSLPVGEWREGYFHTNKNN